MALAVFVDDVAVAANNAAVGVAEHQAAARLHAETKHDIETTHPGGGWPARPPQIAAEEIAPVERIALHALEHLESPRGQRRHDGRVPRGRPDPPSIVNV